MKKTLNSKGKTILLSIFIGVTVIVITITAMLFFGKRNNAKVREAYIEYINELDYPDGYIDYPYLDYLRFAFGYVDDDNIPELFLCHGNGHADHVAVCCYDAENATVKQIGEYSSFGQLWYYERQAVIGGQYGGTGFWYDVYESASDTNTQQVLAISASFSKIEDAQEHYYWASPYLGTVSDARDSNNFEDYEVSEEEWNEKSSSFLSALRRERQIAYDGMTPYSEGTVRIAWERTTQNR